MLRDRLEWLVMSRLMAFSSPSDINLGVFRMAVSLVDLLNKSRISASKAPSSTIRAVVAMGKRKGKEKLRMKANATNPKTIKKRSVR